MQTMTVEKFHEKLLAQDVTSREHWAFECPVCGTVHSAADHMRSRPGLTYEDVESKVAWQCIGGDCNLNLGGTLKFHELEVIAPDGSAHPRFRPAYPVVAQTHEINQPKET